MTLRGARARQHLPSARHNAQRRRYGDHVSMSQALTRSRSQPSCSRHPSRVTGGGGPHILVSQDLERSWHRVGAGNTSSRPGRTRSSPEPGRCGPVMTSSSQFSHPENGHNKTPHLKRVPHVHACGRRITAPRTQHLGHSAWWLRCVPQGQQGTREGGPCPEGTDPLQEAGAVSPACRGQGPDPYAHLPSALLDCSSMRAETLQSFVYWNVLEERLAEEVAPSVSRRSPPPPPPPPGAGSVQRR